MRIGRIPVQQGFGGASGSENSSPQRTLGDQKSKSNSKGDEYLPSFLDNSETSKATQTKVEPSISDTGSFQPPSNATVRNQQNSFTSSISGSPTDADQGKKNETSQLLGVKGDSFKTAETQTAQISTQPQTLLSQQTPFDISNINPIWYLLLVPLILIPLLLFRFVMGTSSAYELDRYKYRGPTVTDPEAPNVRGRFKKRPRVQQPALIGTDVDEDKVSTLPDATADSSNANIDPDDNLSFLDEAEDNVSLDLPTTSVNDLETAVPASDLAAELTNEPFEPGDFDLHGDEDQHQFSKPEAIVSNISSESEALNNPSDSDLDFDFFSDDDDIQGSDASASEESSDTIESIGSTDETDKLDDEQLASFDSESEDVAIESAAVAFSDSESDSVSNASDDDLSFFDDSDDGFSMDDAVGDAPEIAASDSMETDPIEETSQLEETLELETSESKVTEESKDQTIETAVAAAGAAAVAAGATAKSGSWMSRLFGGRKKKQRRGNDIPVEEDAIAATAVKEREEIEELEDLSSVTEDQLATEPVAEPVFAEGASSTGALTDDPSGEFDFSDSGESFSLEGDDSSDGLFDDDSDADYNFDAEIDSEPTPVEVDVKATTDAEELDSVDDVKSMWEEPDKTQDSDAVQANAETTDFQSMELADEPAANADLVTSLPSSDSKNSSELDSVDDIESMWEEPDVAQENDAVQANAKVDDSQSIGLADEPAENVDPAASSLSVESEEIGEEFNPIGLTSSSEELPLLEDKMLDKLVESDAGDSGDSNQASASSPVNAASALPADTNSKESSDVLLSELQRRVDELESQNAAMESDRSSLQTELKELREAAEKNQVSAEDRKMQAELQQKQEELERKLADERQAKQELETQNKAIESEHSSLKAELEELKDAAENSQVSAEDQQKQEELQQKQEELEQQLVDEQHAKQELEERLAAESEAKQQAANEADEARTQVEAAKAEIEKATNEAQEAHTATEAAKLETEKAAIEAAEFRQKADEALATVRELEQAAESQNASTGSLGGSLLAAAGGAVAGAAIAGGSDESASVSQEDDPFRLEPEQVKKMLMKLKVERKKRLKTKQHFLEVDAKRREVTETLQKVTGELDNLKLEFEKVSNDSSENVSKEDMEKLVSKLNSAEQALKKKNAIDLETTKALSEAKRDAQVATEEVGQLTSRLDEAKLESSSLNEKIDAADTDIESLKSQLEQRDRQLNSLTGQLAQVQSVNDQQVQSHENAQGRLDRVTAQLDQLQKIKQSLGEQLHLEQEKAASASAETAERNQQIQSLRDDWDVHKSQLLEQVASQASSLTELNEQLINASDSRQQSQSQLLQLTSELDQQKARHQSELTALKTAQLQELNTQRRELKSSVQSSQIELKHYQGLLSESKQHLAQSKEQANASGQKLALVETQLNQALIEMKRVTDAHQQQLRSLEKVVEQAKQSQKLERSELQQQLQSNQEAHAITVRDLENELAEERLKRDTGPRKPSKAKQKAAAPSKQRTASDDLTLISGVGPVAAKKMKKRGVETLAQIANWTAEDVKHFSQALSVGGRIKQEKWVQQAKKLVG